MPNTIEANQTRSVRTTVLTIDWDNIDWDLLTEKCCLVRYDLPPKSGDYKSYFQRIHNWYKEQCDEPCYFFSPGQQLYVLFDSPTEIRELKENKIPLNRTVITKWDLTENFHCLVKTLVSNYFRVTDDFVSNADFILRAQNEDDKYILGLKVKFSQDGHEPENFLITDEAFRLKKTFPTEIENADWSKQLCYGRFYRGQMAIFKQLKSSQVNNRHHKDGIYVEYHNSNYRASITYHSLRSMQDLEESRSYLLSNFISKLLPYLSRMGLPFTQKYFEMESVETIKGEDIKKSQIPNRTHPLFVVDGRIKPENNPDNFLEEFCLFANSLLYNDIPVFQRRAATDLCEGDWALRIQDYSGEDFSNEDGIFKDIQDPKPDFYRKYENVVKQSININPNTDKQQDELKSKTLTVWPKEKYLDYTISDLDRDKFELNLEVCVNQLFLKDIVTNPQNVSMRLPQIKLLEGKVYIFKGVLLYTENETLRFFRVTNNNLDAASEILRNVTGKDLLENVFIPAANYSYKRLDDPKAIGLLLGRKFIVSNNYVIEIIDSEIRVLNEDMEIKRRFEKIEETRSKISFFPQQPITGNEYFTKEQLQLFSDFLDNQVREYSLSYNDLKFHYGKHIRDDRGKIIVKNGGFYQLLGIVNDSKLRRFYEKYSRLKIESVRQQSLVPVYQGIWYSSANQNYLVGSPYGRNVEQERGFVLRKIVCHDGNLQRQELYQMLKNEFFPLLEVNFVRFRNYTVYPLPFKLIDIWIGVENWK